jgi:hypothetical protein
MNPPLLGLNFTTYGDSMPPGLWIKDFPLAVPALARVGNPVALFDGEWLAREETTVGKLVRATDVTSLNAISSAKNAFPSVAQPGRTDVQATGGQAYPVLYSGLWLYRTRIFDSVAIISGGAAISTRYQPLKVATITDGVRNYSGLVGAVAGDGEPVVAYVEELAGSDGFLTIRRSL